MNNQKYAVNLYQHNIISYEKIKKAFIDGQKVVGIVHATGTGKSYNALQLAYDNKDKKIVYVVPSVSIIEHIKSIINDNSNLDMERDFANLEFRTYQSFVNMSREDFEKMDVDLLILDEFHHIGAPIWGARINMLIETHPEMKIFGMTAYTIRDRGTPYERDMANPEQNELFSNKIVSRYDLSDAMIDGVLPKPIYKTAHVNLLGLEKELEERVLSMNVSSEEYTEYMSILSAVKKRINESSSIPKILKKSIKPNGKYIYFCPPNSLDGTNDIETIKEQAFEWFKQFVLEDDIIFYTSTSKMGDLGKLNREAFYDDVSLDGEKVDNKLRVMFAINQYNEGIHSPNIDGVILGRGTSSDIVYFEQLGRALAVRGDTKEKYEYFEKYSYEELLDLCRTKDILIKENISKEEIIEKLLAPVVIDLTNNYDFIKELENNLKDRVRMINTYGVGGHKEIKIRDISFDIEVEDHDLFEMLKYVKNRLTMPWEEMYEYAKNYYLHHGDLEVSINFKTNNGYEYDENGKINLGKWISNQRINCNIDSERGRKLLQIGMRFENIRNRNIIPWEEMYEYAKIYYLHHGDLGVSYKFKTNNGYEYDENGKINLGIWIRNQRRDCNVDSERGQKLLQIGMRFENMINRISWEEMYEYAKNYYLHHGDLEVSINFKTNNGYEYDENGKINLGKWISNQRSNCNIDSERGQKLLQIGMRFENMINRISWEEMYEYAKIYYIHHGDLEVFRGFKTNNGYEYDENGKIKLGIWVSGQRRHCNVDSDKGRKLLQIGMRFENMINRISWEEMYEYAKIYYIHHGDLEVSVNFKTNNGYEYDENGKINLCMWISNQRRNCNIDGERGRKLLQIGMRFENMINRISWEEMYEYAKNYYLHRGNLEVSKGFKTNNGYEYDENGLVNLGKWVSNQRSNCNIDSDRGRKLLQIGMRFNSKKTMIDKKLKVCEIYGIDVDINQTVINHISIQELIAKIHYLKENEISIISSSGKLHEIFSISSIDMREKYGLDLEELINIYYISLEKSKKRSK